MRSDRLLAPRRDPTLAEVLAVHDAEAALEHALPDNLGDGYLLRRLPLHRRLRSRVVALGYRLTTQDRYGYLGWPLGSLRALIEARELVYVDNVRPLRREHARGDSRLRLSDLRVLRVAENPLAHESAHCVAHAILFKGGALEAPPGRSLQARRRWLVRTQLCEAFANACEIYAQPEEDSGPGLLFGECAFYFKRIPAQVRAALARLRDVLGPRVAFGLLLLAYLHANFLYATVPVAERRRTLALLGARSGLPRQVEAAIAEVFSTALKLNTRFQLLTTPIYFRQVGFHAPFEAALDFDFLGLLERDPELMGELDTLCRFGAGESSPLT